MLITFGSCMLKVHLNHQKRNSELFFPELALKLNYSHLLGTYSA